MHLIESSHDLLLSGYAYDSVPLGQAVMEHDIQSREFPSGEGTTCNDQFPQRWESPQGPADLGSAIGLAPQSLGLLGGLRDGMGVS